MPRFSISWMTSPRRGLAHSSGRDSMMMFSRRSSASDMRESWPWMWVGDRPQAGMRTAMIRERDFMASRDGFDRGDLGVDEAHVEGEEFLGFSGLDEFVDDEGGFAASTFDDYGLGRIHGRGSH